MAQKTITSFFTRKPLQNKEENKIEVENVTNSLPNTQCSSDGGSIQEKSDPDDSPIKVTKRIRRRQIIDSDEEASSDSTPQSSKQETVPNSPKKSSGKRGSHKKSAPVIKDPDLDHSKLHPAITNAINNAKKTKVSSKESTESMEKEPLKKDSANEDFTLKMEVSDSDDCEPIKKSKTKSADPDDCSPKMKGSKEKSKKKKREVIKKSSSNQSSVKGKKQKTNTQSLEVSETTSPKKPTSLHSFFAPKSAKNEPQGNDETSFLKEKRKSSDDKHETENEVKKHKSSDKTQGGSEATGSKSSLLISKSAGPESDYNPATGSKYHPIDDACWKHGERVPYMALAKTMEAIENISARLKIIEILSNYLRSVIVLTPEDLLPSVYLCLNRLAPAYEGIELGIADQLLMKAIAQTTGRTLAQVKLDAQETGDLGIVAERSKSTQRMMFQPAKLTVKGVFEKLKEIGLMTGQASQAKKIDKIQHMFVACRQAEARFLIRSLHGKLRIGLAEQSVLQALAQACVMTPPGQKLSPEKLNACQGMSPEALKSAINDEALILKTTYCECPNYDMIIPILLKSGISSLPDHCHLTPGIPLQPMLAHPTKGVQEVLSRFDGLKFTCEWKYDGERAQIHMGEDGKVSIYSRNQENNTSKYPDVISRLATKNCLGKAVKSFVLDTEAVAWDPEKQTILPFQILSTRKRKDAVEDEIKVPVIVFMFDLLYLNGEPLVRKSFAERRRLLHENFNEVEGQFKFACSLDATKMEEVQEFLEVSVKGNCEGLMVKTLEEEATYEIAKRSRNWLKLKKDYLEGCGDTLDVVVIGGYLGRGKRTGTYGGFLLACYDPDNEEYQSICKIGTGFTDEDLQKHSDFLKEHIIPDARSYYRFDSSHVPDHWFDTVQVWEIKCADLSLSPAHRAAIGIVDPEKGISLRFPRFLRIRDDKTVEDATSARQVADLYLNQEQIKNQTSGKEVTEEDYF